jgi:hypothetical protein
VSSTPINNHHRTGYTLTETLECSLLSRLELFVEKKFQTWLRRKLHSRVGLVLFAVEGWGLLVFFSPLGLMGDGTVWDGVIERDVKVMVKVMVKVSEWLFSRYKMM